MASEGVNVMLAGQEGQAEQFLIQLARELGVTVEALDVKRSYSQEIPFRRLFIKVKSSLIPMDDARVDAVCSKGKGISALELKKWLDEGRDFLLLDTRNDFEFEMGSFEKAIHLNIVNFRDFPKKLDLIKQSRSKPVVMFCTGGIRCEKASLLLEKEGFSEVYQLEGGILRYFELCGDVHYRGLCFVFDERVALNGELKSRS